MDHIVIRHLRGAADEIRKLRHENEVLRAKDEAFQLAGRLLDASLKQPGMTLSVDIVWEIERFLFEEESKMRTQEVPQTADAAQGQRAATKDEGPEFQY